MSTKYNLSTIKSLKTENKRFAMLTCYDNSFAKISQKAGIESLLVGDSLGNVIQGKGSTVPVTVDDICYHTACVVSGAPNCYVLSDMPYMSYTDTFKAIDNATLISQAGAQMLKLEGGRWLEETIYQMSERGFSICIHLGLLPQSINKLGHYSTKGKSEHEANMILEDARCLEAAGADMILLECVPAALATTITQQVKVPVVGIGAGPGTDAQVMVNYDILGVSPYIPSFAQNFIESAISIEQAIKNYGDAVRNGSFPNI